MMLCRMPQPIFERCKLFAVIVPILSSSLEQRWIVHPLLIAEYYSLLALVLSTQVVVLGTKEDGVVGPLRIDRVISTDRTSVAAPQPMAVAGIERQTQPIAISRARLAMACPVSECAMRTALPSMRGLASSGTCTVSLPNRCSNSGSDPTGVATTGTPASQASIKPRLNASRLLANIKTSSPARTSPTCATDGRKTTRPAAVSSACSRRRTVSLGHVASVHRSKRHRTSWAIC